MRSQRVASGNLEAMCRRCRCVGVADVQALQMCRRCRCVGVADV